MNSNFDAMQAVLDKVYAALDQPHMQRHYCTRHDEVKDAEGCWKCQAELEQAHEPD